MRIGKHMFQSKKISDLITEVLFHILFLPFFYLYFRARGKTHVQALDSYKDFFTSQSEFVIFIILFVVISFIVVLVDTLKT